jgi:hypothetical protein
LPNTNRTFVLGDSTLMELVKGIELDIILDLVEMQIVGFYFNKELEISRQKYATQHEIYMDSFERVFSPSKF